MFHKLLNAIKNWGQGNLSPSRCPLCKEEITKENRSYLQIPTLFGESVIGPLCQKCDDDIENWKLTIDKK